MEFLKDMIGYVAIVFWTILGYAIAEIAEFDFALTGIFVVSGWFFGTLLINFLDLGVKLFERQLHQLVISERPKE